MPGQEPLPLPPQHADILAQALLHDRLVLFVGAGLSRLAPAKDGSDHRLPLWKELTEQVAWVCQEDPVDYNFDPLDLFDAVAYGQQRFKLEQAVREALDDIAFQLSPAHEALKELPWAAVVTTNYDGLLQRLLGGEPVYEEQDYDRLTLPHDQQPRLFQIHGTLRRPHTLTRDDYRLWLEQEPASASVIAAEPSMLLKITRTEFEVAVADNDRLAKTVYCNLLHILVRRLRQHNQELDLNLDVLA